LKYCTAPLVLFGFRPRRERPQIAPLAGRRILLPGIQAILTCLELADHRTLYAARSLTPWAPACLAQWAQQNILPWASRPCPITLQSQCAQWGAIAWIAHSKLSNVIDLLPCVMRKDLS
jgi:hypothetical protein